MTRCRDSDPQALIAGAGPTGLVLALLLARMGVRVRIVDPVAEPGTTSRALAVQARTLEFDQQLGLPISSLNAAVRSMRSISGSRDARPPVYIRCARRRRQPVPTIRRSSRRTNTNAS